MSALIDVRRFPYMPLYMERLRRSKAWLRCKRKPELAFYLMNLWMHAYHGVPAGSVEDDDDVLADAAMCDPRTWDQLRPDVLRGWEERDGRLFHPVVVEVAEEAWTKARANQKRTEAAREARGQMRLDLPDERLGSVTEPVTDHEGKGREEKRREDPATADSTTLPARQGGGGGSLEMQLREASGLVGTKLPALRKTAAIEALISEGLSLESVILPALRAVAADCKDARSWSYFVPAIRRWTGPALSASPASRIVSVWVLKDSPPGQAWDDYLRSQGQLPRWLPGRSGPGYGHPTRWPPGHEPVREAG